LEKEAKVTATERSTKSITYDYIYVQRPLCVSSRKSKTPLNEMIFLCTSVSKVIGKFARFLEQISLETNKKRYIRFWTEGPKMRPPGSPYFTQDPAHRRRTKLWMCIHKSLCH